MFYILVLGGQYVETFCSRSTVSITTIGTGSNEQAMRGNIALLPSNCEQSNWVMIGSHKLFLLLIMF